MSNTEYFYTNDQLGLIMCPNGEPLDWDKYGFTIRDVTRAVQQKFQQTDKSGSLVSLLPISNKVKFNASLGNFIGLGNDGDLFYRVVSEEEAIQIRDELIAQREAQQAQE